MADSQPVVVDHRNTLTLEVLKVIKEAQAQHGLKHSDYHRYRGYCKRRIHRLRRSLGFVQATGNKTKSTYQLKKITNELVLENLKGKKDPIRFLLIVLMAAERCWAYAMALKQEANTEHRKRFHLVRRLAKATMYARILNGLCNKEPNKCDARTKLEVEAYLCYMRGIFNFETEKWKAASYYLGKAQAIYIKLCEAISDEEVCLIYQQRVEELKPTLRFCSFNLGEDKSSIDSFQKESVADEYLASKLDHLILQTREKQAVTLGEVTWLGKVMAVKQEKIRSFLLMMQDTSGLQEFQVEKLLFDCRDCIQLLRESNADKSSLYCYLQFLRHNLTVQRYQMLIKSLESSAEKIRPYEVIIASLEDLKTLPLQQQFQFDEVSAFLEQVESQMTAYKAFRCYNIAKSGKIGWKESVALLHNTSIYARSVVNSPGLDDSLIGSLKQLADKADVEKHIVYKEGLMSTVEELSDNKDRVSYQFNRTLGHFHCLPFFLSFSSILLQKSDKSASETVSHEQTPVQFPPPDVQRYMCKPLFFDLALNHIDLPSLEQETNAGATRGLTGFVKGLWSGGWKN